MTYKPNELFILIYEDVRLPKFQHLNDAAVDVRLYLSPVQIELHEYYYKEVIYKERYDEFKEFINKQIIEIRPGEVWPCTTGLCLNLPQEYPNYCFVLTKSGLGTRNIKVANSPGLIDSNYRYQNPQMLNELMLLLANDSNEVVQFKHNDRVAQVLFPFLVSNDAVNERIGGLGSSELI